MAEGAGAQAGAPPTFKLVLVGDGGTGKVSRVPTGGFASPGLWMNRASP